MLLCRLLGVNYPTFPCENDLRHYVEQLPGVTNPTHELYPLSQFVKEQSHLRAGAAVLPDLVEFYQWLHTDVAYTVSRRNAANITVEETVMKVANFYGDERGDHIVNLFERVKG